jgi:hypothetical protein
VAARKSAGKSGRAAVFVANRELRHRAVIAIVYVRFDSGPLIRCAPGSRAGPEVRSAFCVLRRDGGNFRDDRLRRVARIPGRHDNLLAVNTDEKQKPADSS